MITSDFPANSFKVFTHLSSNGCGFVSVLVSSRLGCTAALILLKEGTVI